jgi:Zn-dependent protease
MYFTLREIRDLVIAWIVISLAFAILFDGISSVFQPFLFLRSLVIAGLTVGIGFLFHELMHKFVAQRYGFQAEFHAFYFMLFLALLFSFFGFILAAPGAVFILSRRISIKQNGIISLAGPLTNIVFAIAFFIGLFFISRDGFWLLFFRYGFLINAWLALFNMIPFMPFDGGKVWRWNKLAWSITVLCALGLFLAGIFL